MNNDTAKSLWDYFIVKQNIQLTNQSLPWRPNVPVNNDNNNK